MFRPINSDDHTRFRPPAEHVKQAEASYKGQKRDFGLEIEQVKDENKGHQQQQDPSFGEDTFESTSDSQQEQNSNLSDGKQGDKERTPPSSGHVDFQI